MSLQLLQYDAPIPKLINELKFYGYKTTSSGNEHVGAPEGHDDCVIALDLAAWQLKRTAPSGIGVCFSQHDEYKRKREISDFPSCFTKVSHF